MFGKKKAQPKWLFCGYSNMVELDFGHVVLCGSRKTENPVKNPSRDRQKREPGEGWIGTLAGTSHHCAMSSLNMIGQIKVTVYLQYKRCSAPGLNCRYLSPYIKLKLIGLAISDHTNNFEKSNFSRLLNASVRTTF